MDRRSYLKTSLLVGSGLLLPAGVMSLVGRQTTARSSSHIAFTGKIMGTSYSITLGDSVSHPNKYLLKAVRENRDRLASRVYAVLQNIDSTMSTWRKDSEISLFNRSSDQDWQPISPGTIHVVNKAKSVSERSAGAFDMTIGPLVNLWGFGPNTGIHDRGFQKPTDDEISKVKSHIGYASINIDTTAQLMRKSSPYSTLDLSGIAKGYAVDQVAELLNDEGFESYLVEVGGELRSRGRKSDGSSWKVAIERPLVGQQDVFRVLNLDNRSIATSGNYRNFYTDGGQRFSHSISPITGKPVTHDTASVTVIAPTALEADALSTTFMILGAQAATDYMEQHHIAGHFILKSPSGHLKELYSSRFEAYFA